MVTNYWTDLVLDVNPIRAIYGANPPTLEAVDLHEMVLHRDGPRVLLRFDLQDFPQHPPKKWVDAGFNRVQIQLLISNIQDLLIIGLKPQTRINIIINKDGPLIRLQADNGIVQFNLTGESLIVDKISAYRDASLA
ncbi:immunity 50 family protein [Chitiniphilus purpureus]|uniref:Immunity 50 family protein n=1 Tax=Chitiniphilus purpureus TaxID=2981137 RepID=A0ABY6DQW1_9NEIS|nr:immunity 50 family protein [Chitiniphilus sp. CD1]UXY16752.1 immunity 50 family protein [Chitiniphilus sp. CD1]